MASTKRKSRSIKQEPVQIPSENPKKIKSSPKSTEIPPSSDPSLIDIPKDEAPSLSASSSSSEEQGFVDLKNLAPERKPRRVVSRNNQKKNGDTASSSSSPDLLTGKIPVAEAKIRWPHRYQKDGDEENKAKAHYERALVDGMEFNLYDCAMLKAEEGEPDWSCRLIGLVIVGALLLLGYSYSGSGGSSDINAVSKAEGDLSCTLEVHRAIPVLQKAYGVSMHKVLHVGPDTCSVVSKLLKEEDTEAWGLEPYEIEETDGHCKSLIRKGIVRIADIKFPLPYKANSFNLVLVSDALDYLSPKYLNKTLPELARVSIDGLVIFAGYPGKQRAKVGELSKFGKPAKLRSSSWWIRYFVQTGLEENTAAIKKFEQAAIKKAYLPSCQIFHLSS